VNTLTESLGAAYFQRALIEAALVGATAGVVGVHVLLRRLQFFVVALSHATFPGVVLASAIGVSLFIGGSLFGIAVAIAVVLLGRARTSDSSSVIGIVVAGAFAIGVVLLTALPSGPSQLTAFLVGSILTVNMSDIVMASVVALVIGVALLVLNKELVFSAFDNTGSAAAGYNTRLLDFLTLVLVVVVSVTMIPAVGTLLAVALLTVPALTARLWAERVLPMMALSAALGAGVVLAFFLIGTIPLWIVGAGGPGRSALGFLVLGLLYVLRILAGVIVWALAVDAPSVDRVVVGVTVIVCALVWVNTQVVVGLSRRYQPTLDV